MPETEQLSNLGYGALKKETSKGTPVIPNVYFHLFKESVLTDLKLDEHEPIVGTKLKTYNTYQGLRSHGGELEVLAEPNTAQYFLDMLLTAGSITDANPLYTHPYTLSTATNPNSYTLDIAKGQIVYRFWGVEAYSLEPTFNKNKMHFNVGLAALGALSVREIATVSTTTITLKTDYDFAPTKGFVATDTVRLQSADGATVLNTTVSSVDADGITMILGASAASFSAGDFIFLRPATPSYSVLAPFEWGRTEFRFATAASDALTAAQTKIEVGSKWKIMHNLEAQEGSNRSGARDPAALVRTQGDAELNVKKFLHYGNDMNRFLKAGAQAVVIRHFSGSTHELRITMNSIVGRQNKPPLETGKIIYQEIDYKTQYNTSDGQGFDVKILNAIAT